MVKLAPFAGLALLICHGYILLESMLFVTYVLCVADNDTEITFSLTASHFVLMMSIDFC